MLIRAILTIALAGFLLWLIGAYVPMPSMFWNLLVIVAVVLLVLWLLRESGLMGYLRGPGP